MQLDIESLRVFLAVLDHGGMTKASQRLNLGQSAVSRKVQRLEDRVGRPLLIRDGHTLRPTRDGRSLLEDARSMVALHDQAVARLGSSELTGTVKLSCNGEVDTAQIAGLLGTFKRKHPGLVVEFTLDHSGSLSEWIETGAIDLAVYEVSTENKRPTDIELWNEQLTWVVSPSSCFGDGPVPLIDFGPHCHCNEVTRQALTDAGIEHQLVFSGASSRDVRAAVQAGIGVASMSSRYLGGDVIEWQPPRPIAPMPKVSQIIRSVPGERPEAVEALIETIKCELKYTPLGTH